MPASDPEPVALLAVRVVPNASKSEICGLNEYGELRVRLQAAPVDGKANKALVSILAKKSGLRKGQIKIQTGQTSRQKWIAFQSIERTDLFRILGLSD